MSRPRIALLSIVLICVVTAGLAFWLIDIRSGSGAPPPVTNASLASVSVSNGRTIVTVPTDAQQQSGITAKAAQGTSQRQSVPAYGAVMDTQPIIDARTRYISAQSDEAIARASLDASRQQAERLRQLLSQNAVSPKDYQAQEAAALSDQAKLQAANLSLLNSKGGIKSQFGEVIAGWVLSNSSDFQRLLAHEDALLRVTLPLGGTLNPPQTITIDTNDSQSVTAGLVSRAAQSDPDIQGTAYIYRVHVPLATGMHVTAHMPTTGTSLAGVIVPSDAVVWYGGIPWVYRKIGPDKFARQQLLQPTEIGKSYFVSRGIAPGDAVVVAGAQLLLSVEQTPPPSPSGSNVPDND